VNIRGVVRVGFGLMYLVAGVINLRFALTHPEVYRPWADTALLEPYRSFMAGVSTEFLAASLILVALYQFALAAAVVWKGMAARVGMWGGILFHLGITPWGVWNLPNLLLAAALALLLKTDLSKDALSTLRSPTPPAA